MTRTNALVDANGMCMHPDRDVPKLKCGYPFPCPWHTAVIEPDKGFVAPSTIAPATRDKLSMIARALGPRTDADDRAALEAAAVIAAGGKPVMRVYLGAGGNITPVASEPRWAAYHHVHHWLRDTGPKEYGVSWSTRFSDDVRAAALFETPIAVVDEIRTWSDSPVEPGEDHTRRGFYVLRVR